MTSQFPNYDRARREYDLYSRQLNEVLYSMCRDWPGHRNRGEIWAKVWIIGRSYASGIERHADGGLTPVVEQLFQSRRWLDRATLQLRALPAEVSFQSIVTAAVLHGRLLAELLPHMRSGNRPRSFVAKYLHFHGPCIPIYDSVVNARIKSRGWYPWQRAWTTQYPVPAGADPKYWKYCVRLAHMAEDWRAERKNPDARMLDYYLLTYRV